MGTMKELFKTAEYKQKRREALAHQELKNRALIKESLEFMFNKHLEADPDGLIPLFHFHEVVLEYKKMKKNGPNKAIIRNEIKRLQFKIVNYSGKKYVKGLQFKELSRFFKFNFIKD